MNKNLIILSSFLIVTLFLVSSCQIPTNEEPIGAVPGTASCSGSGTGTSVYSESSARGEARDNAFENADSGCKYGTACDGRISTSCSSEWVFGIPDDTYEYTCTATLSNGKCSLTSSY